MKKKFDKKEIAFRVFSSVCILLSVYTFELLRQPTGNPTTKMLTSVLIIFLLTVLNITVLVLYEMLKQSRNK